MPSYFAGNEIVAETKNFLVTCDNDPEARYRAQNVGGTCEQDLAALNDLFSTNFEAGNTSDHTIWVHVLKDNQSATANGWNYGYETEESSRILLQRAFIPPPPTPPPPDPPVVTPPNYGNAVIEFPRFVFVAELAEILMGFTGYGWAAGNSMGEGLSNLLGALLHPNGYYAAQQGPRINQWLNGGGGPPVNPPRADFVANTKNTDADIYSYGCSILFINYLVNQLGYPLKAVIRAGGGSLAQNYATLSGQPAGSAYTNLNALLQKHIGNTTTNNMLRDNIFPLYDPANRSVSITLGDIVDKGDSSDAAPVQFELRPGIVCHAAKYDFFRQHEQVEQPLYAHTRGLANASFRWSIEGVDVAVRNQFTNIVVNTPVTVKDPDGKTELIAETVQLQYGIIDTWNGSVLYVKTVNTNGNCSINISVAAKEAAANDAEVSASEQVDLDTVLWQPGDAFKRDSQRCNPYYVVVDKSFWGLTQELIDIKNRPDPTPERTVIQIVEAVHELDKAVAQYARGGHMTADEVWKQIGRGGRLRSTFAPAAGPDLTRLRLRDLQKSEHD